MEKKNRYSSIQLTTAARNELSKKRRNGETYEEMLRRKGLLR
jgi:hypothetical protein